MKVSELIECLKQCDGDLPAVTSDGKVIEVVEETPILTRFPDKLRPVVRVIGEDYLKPLICKECKKVVVHEDFSEDYEICGDCYEKHLDDGFAMKI